MTARKKKKNKGYYRLPVFICSLVVFIIVTIAYTLSDGKTEQVDMPIFVEKSPIVDVLVNASKATAESVGVRYEIPTISDSRSQQIIEHVGYTVSYNHNWHLPNWVAYELTPSEVCGEYSRTDKFLPDPFVEGDPVVTQDYSGSGYDRGHMAPAADMKWSEQAMKESFYMTNMCPQNHNNNAGDWKDLEELVRDIARKYGNTYICVGPIVSDASVTIGKTRKIVVPQAFYKVLLRQKSDGTWTSIGFVMPNEAGNRPMMSYMVSVNDVESMTGIDFFPNLPDTVEETIESNFEVSDWTI